MGLKKFIGYYLFSKGVILQIVNYIKLENDTAKLVGNILLLIGCTLLSWEDKG